MINSKFQNIKFLKNSSAKAMAIMLIAVFLIASFAITEATNVKKIKGEIKDTKKELENLNKEIKIELDEITKLKNKENNLKSSIAILANSQDDIQGSISLTETNISAISKKISELRNTINKKTKEIEKKKTLIADNIKVVNKTQQVSPILIFLSSGNFSDFINSFVFINRVNNILSDQTKKVIAEKKLLSSLKKKEEENKRTLVNYRKDLDNQRKELEKAGAEKETLLEQATQTKKEREGKVAEKQKAKKQFKQQLYSLEASLPKIDVKKTVKKATSGQFMRPVSGGWISAEFGRKSAFHTRVYKNGFGHNGVDFAVPTGTKVRSVAAGVVTDTGDSTRVCSGVQYGKWVLIRHNNGTSSMYAHLSHIGAYKGQTVSKGTIIGRSGSTGYSTGPHLHVTMYATKAVRVKTVAHSFKGKCYGKLMKLPISPHSGYLDPFVYIPR